MAKSDETQEPRMSLVRRVRVKIRRGDYRDEATIREALRRFIERDGSGPS